MISVHNLPAPLRWYHPAVLLSTGFGSGLLKPASGTWGSLACFALISLFWFTLTLETRFSLVFLTTILAIVSIKYLSHSLKRTVDDESWIVSDEFIGLMIAVFCAHSWPGMIAGFVFFRLFDIWKPGPVKWAENWGDPAVGIVADDIVAGLMAMACVWGLETYAFTTL